jgi:hypothetical protein
MLHPFDLGDVGAVRRRLQRCADPFSPPALISPAGQRPQSEGVKVSYVLKPEALPMAALMVPDAGAFEIRFESLFHEGRALVFPCDACGRVDLDALPARARSNYLYARALMGRDYAAPQVLNRRA